MAEPRERPTAAALVRYFLYLGSLGFGGPVALVGYMQRDLVERRGWFTREEYLKSLALSQLAPSRPSWPFASATSTPGPAAPPWSPSSSSCHRS
jgi:chromate transport protein ChrA